MDSLDKANTLFSTICAGNPHITPITPDDGPLFMTFFQNEPISYGNSWPYIVQGMYGLGPYNMGYKYYDGTNLSALSINSLIEHPETMVLYWVRPMGPTAETEINTLAEAFLSTYNMPTSVTKIFKSQYDKLIELGFSEIEVLPWHSSAPMEDDSHPEIVNNVEKTVLNTDKKERIKKAVKQYEKISEFVTVKPIQSQADSDVAWDVACKFFKQQLPSLTANLSSRNDYHNLIYIQNEPQYHNFIIYKGDEAVGYFDYYEYNKEYACAYASLMLRQIVPNLEDFTMIWLFNHLHNLGITYLNQGGSETEGMDDYKKKFVVESENKMYWCVKK